MKRKLAGLRPMEEPERGADEMREWRRVLEVSHPPPSPLCSFNPPILLFHGLLPPAPSPPPFVLFSISSHQPPARKFEKTDFLSQTDRVKESVFAEVAAEDDPFCRLLEEAVLPHLRSSIANLWQPRDPEPLLRWLEAWDSTLPPPVRDNSILRNLVLPALQRTVESWEPRRETVPVHSWLHPWLPWLGSQLKPLYDPLRFKLSRALEVGDAIGSGAVIVPFRCPERRGTEERPEGGEVGGRGKGRGGSGEKRSC